MQSTELFNQYPLAPRTWDEMYDDGNVRLHYQNVFNFLLNIPGDELSKKEELAKKLFMSQGITFTVYSSGEGIEKIFPFDIIPRIIRQEEWSHIEKGIRQRLRALNVFLKDVYHHQFIIKDGVMPAKLIYSCPNFLRQMMHVDVPFDIYTHVAGIDLIRDHDGDFYVLE